MSEENIPSENSKKEILNSKQEEVTKNISQQETIEQTTIIIKDAVGGYTDAFISLLKEYYLYL